MTETFATDDPVVAFASLQLFGQSRTLARLTERYRRQPSALSPRDIQDEIIRTQQAFTIATAAVEQSCHTIDPDSCFGVAVREYLSARTEAAAALRNRAEAA
jgi:hypothetical protein